MTKIHVFLYCLIRASWTLLISKFLHLFCPMFSSDFGNIFLSLKLTNFFRYYLFKLLFVYKTFDFWVFRYCVWSITRLKISNIFLLLLHYTRGFITTNIRFLVWYDFIMKMTRNIFNIVWIIGFSIPMSSNILSVNIHSYLTYFWNIIIKSVPFIYFAFHIGINTWAGFSIIPFLYLWKS